MITCLLLTFAAPAPATARVEDGIAMGPIRAKGAEPRAGACEAAPRVAGATAGGSLATAPEGAAETFAAPFVGRVATRLYLLNCALLR